MLLGQRLHMTHSVLEDRRSYGESFVREGIGFVEISLLRQSEPLHRQVYMQNKRDEKEVPRIIKICIPTTLNQE